MHGVCMGDGGHEGDMVRTRSPEHRQGQEVDLQLLHQRPLHRCGQRRAPVIAASTNPRLLIDLQGQQGAVGQILSRMGRINSPLIQVADLPDMGPGGRPP